MGESDRPWRCPWCGKLAGLPTYFVVICQSRVCECGALSLGAVSWDTDEIVDDAINVFGPIPSEYVTPLDADRVAGLERIGVEVAGGSGSDTF